MRRLLLWYVPAGAAVAAVVLFGVGFYSFLRGDTGTPVNVPENGRAAAAQAPRGVIVPIILGDSLAKGTGDETGLGIGGRVVDELRKRHVTSKNIVNISVNGARTADLLQQLDSRNVRTLLAESNVIIVSIGGNDLWGGSDWRSAPPADPDKVMNGVADRIEKIRLIIRSANPNGRVFLIGLYNPFLTQPFGAKLTPLVNRWNAKLTERFSEDPNFTVVQTSDIFAFHDRLSFDRFHPGDEGYALIARRIADSI